MGFRNVSWRNCSRRVVGLLALSTLALAPSASVAGGGSTALVPYTQTYNGRSTQLVGQVIEARAVVVAEQRGLTGVSKDNFVKAAIASGGIAAVAAAKDNARAQNAATGALLGGGTAALGFGAGCLAVAVATTAGFASPLCALPALIGGIASGVAVGGAIGLFHDPSDDTAVTNPGNLAADAPVTGSTIPAVTQGSNGNAGYFKFLYNDPNGSYAAALSIYGFNRTFICSGGFQGNSSAYRECIFVQLERPYFDSLWRYNYGFMLDAWKACDFQYYACTGSRIFSYETPTNYSPSGWQGAMPTPPAGFNNLLLTKNLNLGSEGQAIPVIASQRYDAVSQIGYPLPGLADNSALAGKIDKGLSNQALANFINEIMKHWPATPQGEFAYDATNPITASDVKQVLDANPQLRPSLGDMLRPMNAPGQSVQLGSSSQNVITNVSNVNPTTSTTTDTTSNPGSGSNTGTEANPTITKEKAATDAEKSAIASGVMAPLQNLLNSIPKPEMVFRDVTCPALTIDTRGPGMKSIGMDFVTTTDFHCVLAEQIRAAVQAFMLFIAGLAAWRRFMSA